MARCVKLSARVPAAIDEKRVPGDEIGSRAGEENRRSRPDRTAWAKRPSLIRLSSFSARPA